MFQTLSLIVGVTGNLPRKATAKENACIISNMTNQPKENEFIFLLKACSRNKDLREGTRLHKEIHKRGLIEKSHYIANTLISMYAKCGAFRRARQVLEELSVQSVIAWNALIAGYSQLNQWHEALNCLEKMQAEGLVPNAVTFLSILKVCSNMKAVDKGRQVHQKIMGMGLFQNDTVLANVLVDMYAKCGELMLAMKVLNEIPNRNVVSWSTIIAGHVHEGFGNDALDCFSRMESEGISPNSITYIFALKACGITRAVDRGKQIHSEIVRRGMLDKSITLGTALVDMYAKCSFLTKARQVLEDLPVRNVVSWSALIVGYAQEGRGYEALVCFEQMQSEGLCPDAVTFICILRACGSIGDIERGQKIHDEITMRGMLRNDVPLCNALVDMYIKCGMLAKAQNVLQNLDAQDVVSWSALISGYAQQGQCHEALNCFKQMQHEGFSPNAVTFISLLGVCGVAGAIDMGRKIHDEIVNMGLLQKDIALGTALIDMYAKCGMLIRAQEVLDELPVHDVISWNALIAGYAQKKQDHAALKCFRWMQNEAISPDEVTFLCVLNACNHSSLSDVIRILFKDLSIIPCLQHHTCMVAFFGYSGQFDKAMTVINGMQSLDHPAVWLALLGGCRKWGNMKLAKLAFDQALQVNDIYSSVDIHMKKIFTAAGMQ